MTDTYHQLLDIGKSTVLSQVTVDKMEDIRKKTQEKEELDKAVYFKKMLYLDFGNGTDSSLGMATCFKKSLIQQVECQ